MRLFLSIGSNIMSFSLKNMGSLNMDDPTSIVDSISFKNNTFHNFKKNNSITVFRKNGAKLKFITTKEGKAPTLKKIVLLIFLDKKGSSMKSN